MEDVFIVSTECQNTGRVQASFAGTADGSRYYANTRNAGGIKIEIQDRDADVSSYTYGTFKTVNPYKIIMQPLILKPVQ